MNTKTQIEQNDYKMRTMEKSHGDKYFDMFGNLVMNGYPIQKAIDVCWEIFKP